MANRHRTGDAAHSSRPPQPPAPAPAAPPPSAPRPRAYRKLPHDAPSEGNRDLVCRFGQILRAARLRRGYSQEDLAQRATMHRTHISLIETGTRNIRITTICALAAALRTNPGDLMPVLFLPDNTLPAPTMPPHTHRVTSTRPPLTFSAADSEMQEGAPPSLHPFPHLLRRRPAIV